MLTDPYLLGKILSYAADDAYAFRETCTEFRNTIRDLRLTCRCSTNTLSLVCSASYTAWARSHPGFQYTTKCANTAVDLELWDRLLCMVNSGCPVSADTVGKLCTKRRRADLQSLVEILEARSSCYISMSYEPVEKAIRTGDADYLKLVYRIGRVCMYIYEDEELLQRRHELVMLAIKMGNVEMLRFLVSRERLEDTLDDVECFAALESGDCKILRYVLKTALPMLECIPALLIQTKYKLLSIAKEQRKSPKLVKCINEVLNEEKSW